MNVRHVVLAVALAATLAASWWVLTEEGRESSVVLPVERSAGQRPGSARLRSAEPRPELSGDRMARLALGRGAWPDLSGSLARIVSFAPPPPPQSAVRTEPQAPPLPFRYVGMIDDAQGKAVFLLEGNQVRMARPGEEVASRYRLERITPSAIEFKYLPLNKTQTLSRLNP